MANIILLHGAWHGPWCFEKLIPELEIGNNIIIPELPCVSYDNNDVNLEIYNKIVINELNKLGAPAILVGHSLAGLILCELGSRFPDKISKLVFIAGFIPENSSNLMSCSREDTDADMSLAFMPPDDKTILTLNPDNIAEFLYNNCSAEDKAWAVAQLQPQKLTPFNDKVSYDVKTLDKIKKVYIECEHDRAVSLNMQQKMHARINCEAVLLNSCHSPFICMPDKIAEIILR